MSRASFIIRRNFLLVIWCCSKWLHTHKVACTFLKCWIKWLYLMGIKSLQKRCLKYLMDHWIMLPHIVPLVSKSLDRISNYLEIRLIGQDSCVDIVYLNNQLAVVIRFFAFHECGCRYNGSRFLLNLDLRGQVQDVHLHLICVAAHQMLFVSPLCVEIGAGPVGFAWRSIGTMVIVHILLLTYKFFFADDSWHEVSVFREGTCRVRFAYWFRSLVFNDTLRPPDF